MMYLSANKDVGIPNNSIIAIKERTLLITTLTATAIF